MLKVEDNPPMIWPENGSIRDLVGRWWVAHTRARNEKALAHDLISRNVSYFLPMSWKVRRKSRRTTRSLLPLFGGYVFFCGDEDQRIQLLQTNRVAGLIEVTDQQQLITELVQIQQALCKGVSLMPDKYIRAGQRCRVTAGPLMGLQGVIVKAKNSTRLQLQVDMLGQAASVEIDTELLEFLD